jgi:rhamnosyltransferase subunit B
VRIVAVAAGSLGDIIPFLGPVRELLKRDNQVELLVPPQFVRLLRRAQFPVSPVGGFVERAQLTAFHDAVWSSVDGRAPLEAYWNGIILSGSRRIAEDLTPYVQDVDVCLVHYHSIAGHLATAQLPVPVVKYVAQPACLPSSAYPPPSACRTLTNPGLAFGLSGGETDMRRTNRRLWDAEIAWAEERLDAGTNELLEELGLASVTGAPFGLPSSASQLLMPSHQCLVPDQPDWPTNTMQVGYPVFDELPGYPDKPILDFLDTQPRGRPVALVSFGTAVSAGLDELYSLCIDALTGLGFSVISLGYGSRAGAESENHFSAQYAAVSQLAPRCDLVIHHGGPGIAYTTLRAGRPAVAIPQFLDQGLVSASLERRDVAIALQPEACSKESLIGAISKAMDAASAATELQDELSEERDPSARVADAVEAWGGRRSKGKASSPNPALRVAG